MIFPRGSRWILTCVAIVLAAAVASPVSRALSAEEKALPAPAKPASAESEIRATAVAFVEAFNRGDARAVAALWTADGSAADDSGTIYKGRPAIEAQYAELFKQHPGARMEVAVKSIEFPTPTTAIEDGVAQVEAEHAGPPQASRYTAVHIKQDGKWLMASVREASIELPSNFARVEGLVWLVGTWTAERDGTTVHTTIRWIANKSFLEREYTTRKDGMAVSSGRQIIGWDPKARQIRSWSFDAAGGYGTGLWTATPDGWRIESSGVLPDGVPTSSRDVLIRVPGDDNVLGWRSVARSVGGASLPDTPEVVLDRISEKK
ncbi:MAG: SgcJ/EcaC family oxidoreductase [Thermoguttaceae bacterium]